MTIPAGFTTLTPYIAYDKASDAIDLYKKAFDAKEIERIPLPNDGVAHAILEIGSARLMLSDIKPNSTMKSANTLGGSPISFYVYIDDIEASFEQAKNAGMTVVQPIEEQFWGEKMGVLVDRFQIMWALAQYIRDVSREELIEGQKLYTEQLEKNT